MGGLIHYNTKPGETVRSLREWAEIAASAVRSAVVKARDCALNIDSAVADTVEVCLAEAFEAGVREGESRMHAKLASVIQGRVEKAIKGMPIEIAPCPHCLGRGCPPCGDTGKRQRDA